ncbi:hypothetical protein MJO28_011560 [Puccinia striiformis f. sp. tritici]|uniref:Uncharacterized protein n=2 Tax=Puccinia striiformis TaxID=27350 RepID=A0A2S4WJM1_9BASI|nr:hypothetical protein MJO28_011560 [Puccinia striiformis f. sp. tritici]POW21944.1 hypothetical protein PSHT_01882 [Puccinia striiformis]
MQTSLDYNLDQIQSTMHTLYPKKNSNPWPSKPMANTREQLKYTDYMAEMTQRAIRIRQLGLPTEKCDHPRNTRDRLDLSASWSQTAIESTIRWVNGSELDLVQLRWPDQLQEIDPLLKNFVTRTYSRT